MTTIYLVFGVIVLVAVSFLVAFKLGQDIAEPYVERRNRTRERG